LDRGLRQGILSLPSYFFLLAAEDLHVMMSSLVDHNHFSGYQVGSYGSLAISHLQFVDDTLLLGPRSWANVRV